MISSLEVKKTRLISQAVHDSIISEKAKDILLLECIHFAELILRN